jgi:hypothetical protein
MRRHFFIVLALALGLVVSSYGADHAKQPGLGADPATITTAVAASNSSAGPVSAGGFEVAFQANTGSLWTVGSAGNHAWALGMRPGTSPAITNLAGGGYEVAFQANTGSLWTVGTAGNHA